MRELPHDERELAFPVLEKSFEGWYLWHAKRTLRDVDLALGAFIESSLVGVSMLKMLDSHIGYVYYIAVSTEFRKRRIGSALLEKSLAHLVDRGADLVFAGISEDNVESKALFASLGFTQISFSEISKLFGRLHAIVLYRKMTIVSGEVVYVRRLTKEVTSSSTQV